MISVRVITPIITPAVHPWLLSLRPLGRHSLSVGGPPKNLPVGAPRWRRRDEELRGQQGNEPRKPPAGYPLALSLRPLGRHSLSVGGPPKNLPVGAPRWRRRDEKLRGQQGNEPLKTAGWIPPGCLSLRPLGRHSLSVGGQPKNLPVGAPRWRRRDEELRGQQGNEPLKTAGWIPLAALSPAARPAFFIRWRAAEEFAGRGATMATARRKATGSARQRAAENRWLDPPGWLSLSGRSAGILYPLAGSRRICRSGRHDGDGATKSYGVSKATSR